MAWFYYILIVLVVVLVIVLSVLTHAGFFYALRIRISTPLSMPKRVAYKVHTGPYSNAGPAFRSLSTLVPHLKLFGIYYDDPKEVPANKLRYIVGCCLPENTSSVEELLKTNGYSVWTFPKCTKSVITEFPWRSMVSILIAPWCVYPALGKYCKKRKLDHAGPCVEVYESDCIRYMSPLENPDGFFVPEVAMETETKKDQ